MGTLTLELAKQLKGKKVRIQSHGYAGQDTDVVIKIGKIESEYNLAKKVKNICGFSTQAEYWESFMTQDRLKEVKSRLVLLTDSGKPTFAWIDMIEFKSYNRWAKKENKDAVKSPAFNLGDADRIVSYKMA